jgi:hypothetical protein
MKKLLLAFLFIAAAFIAEAQDAKPTKEATQSFLNMTLSKVVGIIFAPGSPIKKQSFNQTFDELEFTTTMTDDDNYFFTIQTSLIKWETLIQVDEQDIGENLYRIDLTFKSKMKESFQSEVDPDKKIRYVDYFSIYVLREKYESVMKACWRLRAIAKEENNDPFSK